MNNPLLYFDPSGNNAITIGAGVGSVAGPPGAAVGAVVGVVITAAIIIVVAAHAKKGTTNPANRETHEYGQARQAKDKGGEKKLKSRIGNQIQIKEKNEENNNSSVKSLKWTNTHNQILA